MKRISSQDRFRTGKIARLPHAIREQLNRLLLDGRWGKDILPWLNSQPEVRAILDAFYDGEPVSKQNLSNWRRGGYRDWLAHQQNMEAVKSLGANAKELDEAGGGRLAERLAVCMTARIAREFNELVSLKRPAAVKFRKFCALCSQHVALWRTGQNEKWVELERERLKIQGKLADIRRRGMPWKMNLEFANGKKMSLGGHTYTVDEMEKLVAMMARSKKGEADDSTSGVGTRVDGTTWLSGSRSVKPSQTQSNQNEETRHSEQ
jgi:hypothetical protein